MFQPDLPLERRPVLARAKRVPQTRCTRAKGWFCAGHCQGAWAQLDLAGKERLDRRQLRSLRRGRAARRSPLRPPPDTTIASPATYVLGEAKWDLSVMCFAFTSLTDMAVRKTVHDSLRRQLRQVNTILNSFLDQRVLAYGELPDVSD